MERTITVNSKGRNKVVTTTLTDQEALDILSKMTGNSFAKSLSDQYISKGKLSTAQWNWANVLAWEFHQEQQFSKNVEAIVQDEMVMDGVYRLFKIGAEHLKFPKIRLAVINNENYTEYLLRLASVKSKNPGSININTKQGNEWVGFIATDGILIPRCDLKNHPGLVDLLTELASDPVNVAKKYGGLTGNCCFCSLPLTDERSTQAGFGPVCARNYGLHWG